MQRCGLDGSEEDLEEICEHAAGGLCTDGAQEMQKAWGRRSGAGSQFRCVRRMEPREQATAELFRGGANSAAVIRVVNLPENYPRVTDLNVTGVAEGDVAIDLAVDQKDRDSSRGDCIFW